MGVLWEVEVFNPQPVLNFVKCWLQDVNNLLFEIHLIISTGSQLGCELCEGFEPAFGLSAILLRLP